jgi:hypothetical protein
MSADHPPVTQEELERVRDASHKLALQAPGMVGNNPMFATAALALAAVHAAVLTDMTWEQFQGLVQAYWESTSVAMAVSEAREGGATVFAAPKKEGTS